MSLTPLYFFVGMTGMFSMAAPAQSEWLAALPATQAYALTILLSLACAAALTWLTQFRRRHVGAPALLPGFAACGLLVIFMLPTQEQAQTLSPMAVYLAAALRLALFALFCSVAVTTQPVSEHAEGVQ